MVRILHRVCTIPEHEKNPQLDCVDCEERFCADCAVELTTDNSQIGADVCNGCMDAFEEAEHEDEP